MDKRSRKVYVLWGISLAFLLGLGVFCWTVVVPVWRARRVVHALSDSAIYWEAVPQLGGPEKVAREVNYYLGLPEWLAPEKAEAVRALRFCGRPGVETLRRNSRAQDVELRRQVIQQLGECPNAFAREAAPDLVEALSDEDKEVRIHAAASLGKIGADRLTVAPALRKALSDREPEVRMRASIALAWAVYDTGDVESLAAIERLLRDPDPMVRVEAAGALRLMFNSRHKGAGAVLSAAAAGEDAEVRSKANKYLRAPPFR